MNIESPGIRHISQQRFHVPDASLPSTGSARAFVPPLPRYYQGTATSCRPSAALRFLRLAVPRDHASFAPAIAARGNVGPGVVDPVAPSGYASVETTGDPKFLGSLDSRLHMFSDPGRPGRP